ncbi:MAG TPA: SRPBCC domain-containing protein [Pirellulales bacterium]|jgi:carbon monoxide dehydrogenase subunit G|nr:SRPBCC domain-containing protein [Pirellulales bacterium]
MASLSESASPPAQELRLLRSLPHDAFLLPMASDMSSLTFGGEEKFDAAPERVFELLTDLDQLSAAIPDLVSADKIDARTLQCVVRPGFSFLRGTLRVTIVLGEIDRPASAAMHVAARGIGTQIGVESHIRIAADSTGSKLSWTAEVVELKGLAATVGRSLISAAAQQVIQTAWQQVRDRLNQTDADS